MRDETVSRGHRVLASNGQPEAETTGAFTPGPLAVWPSIYDGFAASVVVDVEPLQTLAQVRHYKDALLYAAAPELYEALKLMEAEKADYMRLNHLGDPAKEHTNKRARAAIAKALGQTPDAQP